MFPVTLAFLSRISLEKLKHCTLHTAQKISFPLTIYLVNVTKSAVSCGFITFTEEILHGKLNFLHQCQQRSRDYRLSTFDKEIPNENVSLSFIFNPNLDVYGRFANNKIDNLLEKLLTNNLLNKSLILKKF